jgi:hypothetical protein
MESDGDLLPMTVDDLAAKSGLPSAYIRLAIECGCPTERGLVTHGGVSLWILDNYPTVRAAAGLEVLKESSSTDSLERARVNVRNCLRTLIDYRESRSSNPATKQACKEISRELRL